MKFIDETSLIQGVTKDERIIFTRLEESHFEHEEDFNVLSSIFSDLALNKVADSILYSRLAQRLEFMSQEIDDEEEAEEYEGLSEILDEHSEEEFEFFKDVFAIAMEFGYACGISFTNLPEASSMKFQSPQEMIDFVQNRELKSLFKFYTLFSVMKMNPVLNHLDEESQVEYLILIKSIIQKEIEHFEELSEFSHVGMDDKTQNTISEIKTEIEKGI